jgi:hypothetical protein
MRGISMSDSITAGRSSASRSSASMPSLASDHAIAFAHQQALRDTAHGQRVVHHQHQRRTAPRRLRAWLGCSGRRAAPAAQRCARFAVQRGQRHRVVDQRHAGPRAAGSRRPARQARQLRPTFLTTTSWLPTLRRHAGHALRRAAHDDHRLRAAHGRVTDTGALQQSSQPEERQLLLGPSCTALSIRRSTRAWARGARFRSASKVRPPVNATTQHHDLRDRRGQRQAPA